MAVYVHELLNHLYALAPAAVQESYDNTGLLCGDKNDIVQGVLVCLDSNEAVIDEAIARGCNVVVAHHPLIFKGLKSITGKNGQERTLVKAIRNHISIIAMHTNLDNVISGVNRRLGQQLGLQNMRILQAAGGHLFKLVTFVPEVHVAAVEQAIFTAGAGQIGQYSECSFRISGTGSFTAGTGAQPFVGKINERHFESEIRLECVVPSYARQAVLSALLSAHPYEEPAYEIYPTENTISEIGSGMIGELPTAMEVESFLAHLKKSLDISVIRYSGNKQHIQKVAICGGAGSFLVPQAAGAGADAYVTADVKYHEFFDAPESLFLCDVGHYESEKFTKELLSEWILKKFNTFAVLLSGTNTNPVNYYF